jgi:large subunit ribosomal protein L25
MGTFANFAPAFQKTNYAFIMETIVIKADKRSANGTKAASDIRRNGLVPAIIYGDKESTPVSVNMHEARHAIYTPNFHVVRLNLDGNQVRCIIKDVQFHPVTDNVVHIDFLQLMEGRKMKVEIPLKFSGIAEGIKAGGKLIPKMRPVQVKVAPEHLVDELVLDVTELKLGDSMRIKDIEVGEGVEILNSPGIPVVTVEIPRALKSTEAEAAKEAEAAAEGDAPEAGAEEAATKE